MQRGHLLSGELKQLSERDGPRGETAGPTIVGRVLNDPAGSVRAVVQRNCRQGLGITKLGCSLDSLLGRIEARPHEETSRKQAV